MRKTGLLILMLGCFHSVFAQSNFLTGIKIVPLPQNKVRISLQFAAPLQQQPSSFMIKKPPCIVIDFMNVALRIPHKDKAKELQLGFLNNYHFITTGSRLRMILDMQRLVTYSDFISGSTYSIILDQVQQTKLKKIYTGKPISLNFQDINIRSVLQILADFTGINIVVSDKVQGNITLKLNDIPWDEALDIILTNQGLEKNQTGNVMLIDIKSSLNHIELVKNRNNSKQLGRIQSELLTINYAKAGDIALLIKDKQNSLLSEQGKISVDVRTNSIWIQDEIKKINEVRKLIKQLDIPVKQVLIEARIVEVSKDFAQDLGIRWGVSKPNYFNGASLEADHIQQETKLETTLSYTKRLNIDLIAAPVVGFNPASVGIALATLGDNILLDLELSALESEGRAELISSPKLITTNQKPAIIDSGQEIPYQESTSSGATAVAFKKAVLSLKVTPQITPDHKILMDLKINQDTTSSQLFNGVPAILTKEIQTNVLVSNGQTIVLGGIYQQDKSKTVTRVPFLGQLPLVGGLFRSTRVSLRNDELLIFITPKIITDSLMINEIERNNRKSLNKHGKNIVFDNK